MTLLYLAMYLIQNHYSSTTHMILDTKYDWTGTYAGSQLSDDLNKFQARLIRYSIVTETHSTQSLSK